ncbi:hypothetical protein DFH09DRAFT_1049676 [Mycena vulgaris]|nr:hypothetical protein DFH09DRAFT_1049676 [Mycena vulgaris]
MRLTSLFVTLAAAAVASAQNQTVTVAVGAEMNSPGGIFQFNPSQITATNNSIVTFQFTGAPGNHSITQSSFTSPCEPLANGFDSGWVAQLENTAPTPVAEWNLTITDDSKPIWFFCKQLFPAPHCSAGMVGVINVKPGPNSFSAFQNNAKSASAPPQTQGGLVGVGASASAFPVVPTGATLFGPSATAPGASAPSGSAPSGSPPPSGAVALGFNSGFLTVVVGVLAGAVMVL